MEDYGWTLLVVLAALLVMFWVKIRGKSFDDMLDHGGHEHHKVAEMTGKFPRGGTWRQVRDLIS
jgi:hypothetical protein